LVGLGIERVDRAGFREGPVLCMPKEQDGDDADVVAIWDDPNGNVFASLSEGAKPHSDHENEEVVRATDAHRLVAVAFRHLRANW
jgi:hypothetical protein